MNERQLLVRFGADLSPLEKAVIRASKTAADFGKEIAGLGKSLTSAITVPLVAIGTAAVAASETIDDAMDRIRLGTGAAGDDLDKLGESFRNVFGEVPDSAEQVSVAISELSKRTDLAGENLELYAKDMLDLARISGSEVGPMIESATKAFANWGDEVDMSAESLDFLWKVSQSTGVGITALTDALSANGSTLRAIGVDFETGAALIGQFQKAGVDSGTVMAGLTKAATKFASEGVSMKEGLAGVVEQIKGAKDPTEAAGIASDVFGKSALAMAEAIRKDALSVDEFVASLKASPETIAKAAADTAGLGEAFGILQNKATKALEPLGVAVTKVLVDLMGMMGTFVDKAVKPLIAAFGNLPKPVQSFIVTVAMVAAAVGPALVALGGIVVAVSKVATAVVSLKATAGPAITAITGLFTAAGPMIASAWGMVTAAFATVAGVIAPVVSAIASVGAAIASLGAGPILLAVAALALLVAKWEWVKDQLSSIASNIGDLFETAWGLIKSTASTVWDGIKSVVGGAVSAVVGTAKGLGSALLSAAKSALGPYWDAIVAGLTKVGEFAGKAWDGMKSAVTSVGSFIMRILQGVLDGMGGIVGKIISLASSAAKAVGSVFGGGADAPAGAAPGAGGAASPFTMPTAGGGAAGFTIPSLASPFGGGSSGSEPTQLTNVPKPAGSYDVFGGYNQPGSREIIDPYNLPSSQGPSRDWMAKTPRLAAGGIVTKPTLAMVGEGGEAEAVLPLSKLRGMMGGGGGAGGGVTINVHVSGSVQTDRDLSQGIRKQLVRTGQRNKGRVLE